MNLKRLQTIKRMATILTLLCLFSGIPYMISTSIYPRSVENSRFSSLFERDRLVEEVETDITIEVNDENPTSYPLFVDNLKYFSTFLFITTILLHLVVIYGEDLFDHELESKKFIIYWIYANVIILLISNYAPVHWFFYILLLAFQVTSWILKILVYSQSKTEQKRLRTQIIL